MRSVRRMLSEPDRWYLPHHCLLQESGQRTVRRRQKRQCEVDSDMECGWERIYRRLEKIGRLDVLKCPTQVRNFATDDEV